MDTNVVQQMSQIVDFVTSMEVITEGLQEEIVDEKVVDFYMSRIKMFKEDNMPKCIYAYLDRLNADDSINTVTKSAIIYQALA